MQYHEISNDPRCETLIERLETADISEISRKLGCIPADYISFVSEIGWGEIGRAGYMIYSRPCEVSNAFSDAPDSLSAYVLFGDDFAGYAGAFDRTNGTLAEISLSDWSIIPCDESFFEFITDKFSNQLPR